MGKISHIDLAGSGDGADMNGDGVLFSKSSKTVLAGKLGVGPERASRNCD